MQIAMVFEERIPPEIGRMSLKQTMPVDGKFYEQVELPIGPCPGFKRKLMDEFWTPRGVRGMLETELDQMLCLIDDTAYIESDFHFFTNFA